jgi:hypothetical protein
MRYFSNTYVPPILRLGDTADPIMVVPRNTAALVTRVALVRPVIVRVPKRNGVVIEFRKRLVLCNDFVNATMQ